MPPKILIVDDEPHMVRLASYVLEKAGYEVYQANNGHEALACLETEGADLVLCDITMPDMDGFEIVSAIRANPRWQHLPVVMLTARGQESDLVRAAEVGADGYLTKPFSSSQVVSEVRRHLD
ncbi:MAG TPA: response regulator [Candidatus Thorarchaeota archaeon]|nr:response regulator [Candidatus Thorarchaeota archaeon]